MAKILKKWGALIVAIIMIAIIGVLVFVGYQAKTEYEKTIAQQQASIDNMSTFIDEDIGPLVTCYVTTRQIRVGDTIEEDMLSEVTVPEKIAYTTKLVNKEVTDENGNITYVEEPEQSINFVMNKYDILGKKFKVDLDEGSVILSDFIVDDVLKNDQRYFSIILEEPDPTIKVGDYLDIRIQFGFNQDFIALAHKRVERVDLEYSLYTFIFDEAEINIYYSMLLDKAMYPNVKIHAFKYIDAVQQAASEAYYPINSVMEDMIARDPNILNYVQKELRLEREELNAAMGGDLEDFDDRELQNVYAALQNYRREYAQDMTGLIRERIRREAEEARAQNK